MSAMQAIIAFGVLVMIVALYVAARADVIEYPNGLYRVGLGGTMMCGNALKFNVACNSQYLGKGIIE